MGYKKRITCYEILSKIVPFKNIETRRTPTKHCKNCTYADRDKKNPVLPYSTMLGIHWIHANQ